MSGGLAEGPARVPLGVPDLLSGTTLQEPANDPQAPDFAGLLVQVLPALVHRWNNDLTTVFAVLSLGPEATREEQRLAEDAASALRRALAVVSELTVQRDASASRQIDLGTWLRALHELLAPVAEFRRVALEMRLPREPLPVRLRPRFERQLAAVVLEPLLALEPGAGARLRLVAHVTRRAVVLDVLALGIRGSSRSAMLPEETLLEARRRDSRTVSALRLALGSGAAGTVSTPAPPPVYRPRILVLELTASPETHEILLQHGYRPHSANEIPSEAAFDLVLVDEDWARAVAGWRQELARHPHLGHVACLGLGDCPGAADLPAVARPLPPRALLDRVAGLLGTGARPPRLAEETTVPRARSG